MSRLSQKEIEKTKKMFRKYKENPDMSIKKIAEMYGLKPTCVQQRFRRNVGKEFHEIAKRKIKRKKVLSKEDIKNLFEEYKNSKNITTKILGKRFGLSESAIQSYFKEFFGKEYRKITKIKSSLSGPTKISENKAREIFERYKNTPKLTIKSLAKELKVNPRTIWYNFNKYFREEYLQIRKIKYKAIASTHPPTPRIKVSEDQIRKAFEKYRNGKFMTEIAKNLGIKRDSLTHRFAKVIGEEYIKLAKKRRRIDAGISRRKVSEDRIREAFEKYKKASVPLCKLANEVGLEENSLINRFSKLFGKEYYKISRKRRDERKVSKKGYIEAFERYKNTNISLTELSEKLGIRISSLAPRFRRMFKEEYRKIALKKQDLIEVDRKGRIAEELALAYLGLIGLKVEDVRRRCILKNSLKKPDFVVDDTFIEVKNNYVTFEGFGNVKGYMKIVNDYLGKEINNGHKIILKKGIIISLSGFSPKVRKQAPIDQITLIGPKKLEEKFKKYNRANLIEKLNKLRGLLSSASL